MTVADRPIGEFLSEIASPRVAPSAGAVAGVNGAMAAALCEMVCVHTSAADTGPALADAREELAASRERLLDLADEDATVIEAVQTVFEAGADGGHEQTALRRATTVPMEIAEACLDVLELAVVVAEEGTGSARTDAVVGAYIAHATVKGMGAVVRTNLELIEDESFADELSTRAADAEAAAEESVAAAVGRLTD